jgi:hypothetical protein
MRSSERDVERTLAVDKRRSVYSAKVGPRALRKYVRER